MDVRSVWTQRILGALSINRNCVAAWDDQPTPFRLGGRISRHQKVCVMFIAEKAAAVPYFGVCQRYKKTTEHSEFSGVAFFLYLTHT